MQTSDHVVDVIYHMLDEDEDGRYSNDFSNYSIIEYYFKEPRPKREAPFLVIFTIIISYKLEILTVIFETCKHTNLKKVLILN